MHDLRVTLIQHQLEWENPSDNRAAFERVITDAAIDTDLVILPEMFTTGFSMNALANAEEPGGATEQWMRNIAVRYDCAITGSIAVKEHGRVYNRLLFVTPDSCTTYDKRHLFRMLGEHKRYAPGTERVTVSWRGWRIKLEVCYDLRFPVFSRNKNDYDLLLYVANWPEPRRLHWRTLLQARAIENLAYVVGVNRIGSDANGLNYSGDSLVVDPKGRLVLDMQDNAAVETRSLSHSDLLDYRDAFPAHFDADNFDMDLSLNLDGDH